MSQNPYRTHHCNQLRPEHIGQTVTLSGWVNSARDQGGVIFVDLRDREGITQVVFRSEENPEAAQASHKLRDEDVLQITGKVVKRLEGTNNDRLATGEVELVVSDMKVLNKAAVLPFQIDKELSNEDLRLKYRYLDLRRPRMNRNLRTRHRAVKATRDFLDAAGFVEVETPILSKSTPEGARDFLVPARLNPGRFYALPQAPQQYKQMLMVAGLERYFQIARCFRDEDLRADRQPEFTQIDIEASFVTEEDMYSIVEGLLKSVFQAARGVEIPTPFPRMTWKEAMNRFGIDKPDTRFGNEIVDLGAVVQQAIRLVSEQASRGRVAVAFESAGQSLWRIRGDGRAILQVALNILANAVKFTLPDGRVTARIAGGPAGETVLTVQDTGIGIAADEIVRIFEPFKQGNAGIRPRFGGTGLGLAISKRLVELHGGQIAITSRQGEGTTVSVTIPPERCVHALSL